MAQGDGKAKMAGMTDEDVDFMQTVRENYTLDCERDSIDRNEAVDDHTFVYSSDATVRNIDGIGSQWSTIAFKQRSSFNRPIMQWNRMHIYQQYVVNQARQNDFAIRVAPSDKGTPETAEMIEDRIRQIEYESNSGTVWDIARENQCSSGRGFVQVSTEYIPGTFRQRIKLEEIPDQFSVIFGPGKEYDRSDSERCWVKLPPMSKRQYKRRWGQAALDRASSFAMENGMSDWWNVGRTGDMIQVCQYFQKEFSKVELWCLADGKSAVSEEEMKDATGNIKPEFADPSVFFLDEGGAPLTRTEETWEVWRYIVDGAQILEKEQFMVDEIPIIPQWGLCAVVNGVQRAYSLGNRAKDCQRAVNLAVSNLQQAIGAQVKAKVMAEIEQIDIKAHGDDWAGKTDAAILFYSRHSQTTPGLDLGVPILIQQEAPIQAILQDLRESIEALKAAHGIYDASLGQKSNETSRVAIDARKQQAEIVNYHFLGNESRSRKRAGQIIIKLISVIDTPGSKVTVRTKAGETRMVDIGVEHVDPKTKKTVTHVLSDVDYGVTVDMGPNEMSSRQQVHDADLELMKILPAEMSAALAPEMLRTQNVPNARERAEIATNVVNKLFPGVLPPDENTPQPNPQALMQELQAKDQQLQQVSAHAQSLFEQQQTEQVKRDSDLKLKKMEDDTKRWTVTQQETTKRVLGLATIQSEEARMVLEEELGIAHKKVDLAAQATGTAVDQQHESSEAQAMREHQSAESKASRAHDSIQSDVTRQHEAEQAEASRKGDE